MSRYSSIIAGMGTKAMILFGPERFCEPAAKKRDLLVTFDIDRDQYPPISTRYR
jgi:hypothetical protein